MAFDRELLEWGIGEIERQGPDDRIREELKQLSGFDPDLDSFLGGPASDDRELWLSSLRAALDRRD